MTKKQKKRQQVILIKKFTEFPNKEIYRGTRRKAELMIPPSKADQFEIIPLED